MKTNQTPNLPPPDLMSKADLAQLSHANMTLIWKRARREWFKELNEDKGISYTKIGAMQNPPITRQMVSQAIKFSG